MAVGRAALALVLGLAACAVQGYDLGWRGADRIAPLLGVPRDALSGCRAGAETGVACRQLISRVEALVSNLPPVGGAPEVLGASCAAERCGYANRYERRDVGAALIVPVYRRVVLREARMAFLRGPDGAWRLERLIITDAPAPDYGPVRIGG